MRIRTAVWALMSIVLLAPQAARAQKEYNVWCLGEHAGMDFNGGAPVPIASAFNTSEACASVADPITGRLLFYSDGDSAFNGNHLPMPNGSGLMANTNSSQGALIVPMPGNATRYYLFTSDAGDYDSPPNLGIHYSIVDMSMDGGRGDIVTKNVPLLAVATEKLTAIRHADGCGFWVLCHGWNDSTFYAYLVDDRGVAAPVLSSIGSVHRDLPTIGVGVGTIGYMKPSPDGRHLAVAMYGAKLLELFDFDDRTGVLSRPQSIAFNENPYGVAFSPDNTKLYVSCDRNALYQLDLADPNPPAIAASLTLITTATDPTSGEWYGALQLAPDGKIYHAHAFTPWVGAIHAPNAKGVACGYVLHELDLGNIVQFGLPNLIDAYFASGNLACGAPAVRFAPFDTVICAGSCITFTDLTSNNPTSWNWSFPGATPSSSTERNPGPICFPGAGTYKVTLTAANARGSGSLTRTFVVVGRGDLKAHIEGQYSVAPGDTIAVPLVLDAPVDSARIGELVLGVDYGTGMLRFDTLDCKRGLFNGWRIDSLRDDRASGHCTIYLSAPAGAYLQGAGTMANLVFRAFLGQADTARIGFEFSSSVNRCLAASAQPGLVALNICGARYRLIELGSSSYALDPNLPNPFNPTTTIPFSLGLDGHASLTVHNALGQLVATLIDGDMRAGRYRIPWDATGFPSGLYYYKLVSGPWTATGRMSFVK